MSQRIEGAPRYLSVGRAALLLGVSRVTLIRWDRAGKVRTFRTAGGHRRFKLSDLELYIRASANDA